MNELSLPKIDFPIRLSREGLDSLCRYYVLQYDEKRSIQLISQRTDEFGDLHSNNKPNTIEQITFRCYNDKISGSVRTAVGMKMASFQVRTEYNDELGPLYSGIEFNITPGYKIGELSSDDLELMRELGQSAFTFFERLKTRIEK